MNLRSFLDEMEKRACLGESVRLPGGSRAMRLRLGKTNSETLQTAYPLEGNSVSTEGQVAGVGSGGAY